MKRNFCFPISMALFCLSVVLFSLVFHLASIADQPALTGNHPKHGMLAFKEDQLTKATSETRIAKAIHSTVAVDFDKDLISRSGSESIKDVSVEAKRDDAIELKPERTTAEITLESEQVKPVETQVVEPTSQSEIATTFEDSIPSLINRYRIDHGLPELAGNNLLDQAAQIRAEEILDCRSHDRPDGQPFYSVFSQIGFDAQSGAENFIIASAGYYSTEAIVQAWLDSPVHRANILDAHFTCSGISRIRSGDQEIFVQLFAS